MASNGPKPKKDELVDGLARKLARLSKDDLAALTDAVERGTVDFEQLARDAVSAAAAENGPPFGFQRRLRSAWGKTRRSAS
jgi:hypothetical protein